MKIIKNLSEYRLILLLLSISTTFVLYFLSFKETLGSNFNYFVFSILSLLLLATGLLQRSSIGYMLFSIFIYLGFFLKHVIHLIYSYHYLEPTGKFNESYSQWNEFYEISSIGLLAIIIVGIYLISMNKNSFISNLSASKKLILNNKILNIAWLILIVFGIFLLVSNEVFQFQKLGIVKEEIIDIWFLEMFMILSMGVVFPILMYSIAYFEIVHRNNFYKPIFFILFTSLLFSISILSRSTVLFWAMPLLFLPLFKDINLKQFLYVLALYVIFVFFSVGVSTLMRTTSVSTSVISTSVSTFNRLFIDRWIGDEGLMVDIGMVNKNINNLFYERKSNEVDFFTKEALIEDVQNLEKTAYATLPGIIGYLYLSGFKIIVFLGCLLLTAFIVFIENRVLLYTNNFLLSTYLAIGLASGIAGFGVDFMSWIKVQILILTTTFLIHFILIRFLFLKEEKKCFI